MIIAFDAKRAFYNNTGLGNYSRNTLQLLFNFYPQHEYWLYTPGRKYRHNFHLPTNAKIHYPDTFVGKVFPSYWRSFLITAQITKEKPDIYHGLSNELPFGITQSKTKTVVTIHDLIFKKFPQWYKPIDVKIYDKKFFYAARYAHRVIAVSQQTANDIIEYYKIEPEKIKIVYQSCNPQFFKLLPSEIIQETKSKFNLPKHYLLYVGTIEERKNLHRLIEAIYLERIDIPLVIIGRKTKYYFEKVLPLIQKYQLEKQIVEIENIENTELPAIYQGAMVFIYPSIYEGFGIPLLEALASGTPVLTSKGGCFSEAAGPYSAYANPYSSEEIAYTLKNILNNRELRITMIEKGRQYAKKFNDENTVHNLMLVYEELKSL